MADLILDFMSRTAPAVAALIWVGVIAHRVQVQCDRTCDRLQQEVRRLARELDGEEPLPPSPPSPEPVPRAPLPVARIHRS